VSTEVTVGSVLAGYRIHRLIGRGGMGVVYLATDIRLDRAVALKILAPEVALDPKTRERFLHESRLAAAIDHPSIVPIFGAGEDDGRLWISMRYVDGLDLRTLLAHHGPLDARLAGRLLHQIASALDAAHSRGVIHRDVKPSNILVGRDPQVRMDEDGIVALGEHAYLTDFGLTRRVTDISTKTSLDGFIGTIDYVAPEQIEGGPVDGRTDQYGLAATLYTTLTGAPPFERDMELATIHAHLRQSPPSVTIARPDLPLAVDEVLARGLAKHPGNRFPSATALIEAFEGALAPAKSEPTAETDSRRIRRRRRRSVVRVAVVALVIAAAGTAVPIARSRGMLGGSSQPMGVLEIRLTGGGVVELAPSLEQPNSLTLSSDGKELAVAATGDPTRAIYVVHVGSTGPTFRLPSGYDVDHAPEFSQTGRLAISRSVHGTLHIFLVDPDGSDPVQLTDQVGANDRAPTWSPDGTMIAFQRSVQGLGHIIVMRADPSDPGVDLTPEGGDDGTTRWSPNSKSLAIVRRDAGGSRQIVIVSIDGQVRRNVSKDEVIDGAPAWSPDGSELAFVRHFPGNSDIMVVSVTGAGRKNLTMSPGSEGQPVWSPDGSLIAFVQHQRGNSHICVIASDGTDSYRQLTAGAVFDDEPNWLPTDPPTIVFIRSEPR
jgi:serine/threonine-protein kinase